MDKKKYKKVIVYRVKLSGCFTEWHYESKQKREAQKWLDKFLKSEKKSGYKYTGSIYKIMEEKVFTKRNY